jgi:hypothetical protein
VALDFRPPDGRYARAGAEFPRQPRRRPRVELVAAPPGTMRAQQKFLRALAQLPAALQGPVLTPGRAVVVRPPPSRRPGRPRPLVTRLLAGELQLRSALLLAATLLVVGIVTALGSNLFL